MNINDVAEFITKIEGRYKWYIVAVAIMVLSAIVTRFIFKTLKWFLLIGLVIAAGLLVGAYFR